MPTPIALDMDWRTLTATVNEMKTPNSFLTKLLFQTTQTVPTESIEIGLIESDRSMAPFVKKNGQAISVGGVGEKAQNITPPNIRIKRPFEAADTFFRRRVGTEVFQQTTPLTPIQQHIARQLFRMESLVTNTEEWLVAMAIRGQIDYSVDDLDAWQITFPKPAGNTVTPSVFWDQANSDPALDFLTAKKLVADEVGLQVTDCVMSESAAREFLTHPEVLKQLDNKGLQVGGLSFAEQFRDDGAIYLGIFSAVRCWMYHRTVKDYTGAAVPMIRDKYVEFFAVTPAAENTMYYAAIPDWDLFGDGGSIETKRFSKSWIEKDPSLRVILLHTRPLPVPRRPGSMVSWKAISG